MPTAMLNGTSLHYETVGTGPTCVVVPGWPGTDHAYLRPGLDGLGDRLRLVYHDHRGTGRSGRAWAEDLTVEQLADDVDALAGHLGAERVFVLGHYHGTMVAQELALRHPDRVRGLILVAATPGELGKQESLADTLDSPPKPPEVEILQRVPPASDEELAATMHALAPFFFHRVAAAEDQTVFAGSSFNSEVAAQATMPFAWWSAVDRLADVEVPVLLLVGRHDVFAPPFESARIARCVPQARTRVFDDSGHVPWLEEPAAFTASVHEWLGAAFGDDDGDGERRDPS